MLPLLGWMQVAKLDMINSSHQCPPNTTLRIYQSKRLCGKGTTGTGCISTMFSVCGIKYNQVCGKIIIYQDKTPDAFFPASTRQLTIDQSYVDGISLTHGHSPRKYIWTFASALMKLVLILKISVLALMSTKHHLNHLLLLEMITFVTQGALIITNTFSMVMTHYGMELVVDQPTPAAL